MYFSPSSQKSVTTASSSGYASLTRFAASRCAPLLGPLQNSPYSLRQPPHSLYGLLALGWRELRPRCLRAAGRCRVRTRRRCLLLGDPQPPHTIWSRIPLAPSQTSFTCGLASPERLADAYERAASSDAHDKGIGDYAFRKLGQYLRPEPGADLLHVPLALKLCWAEVTWFLPQALSLWRALRLRGKCPISSTSAPKARLIATRSPLMPSGIVTSIR